MREISVARNSPVGAITWSRPEVRARGDKCDETMAHTGGDPVRQSRAHAQQACENLANVKLPYTLITSATSVPEGPAPAPTAPGAAGAAGTVPAHCDVRGVIRPSRDSEIKFALWLPPASAWNAKYRQEGNGGWAGAINTASFADPLRRGYAVAATDDGHEAAGRARTGPSGIRRN